MRVLVVEDNEKISSALRRGLVAHGYSAVVASGGIEGEELASSGEYDVAVVDVVLPDRTGIEVCRNLRRRGVQSKIVMLTGLNGLNDKVRGLDAGADDYITKPFELDELLARIRALLRRGDAAETRFLKYEDLKFDVYARTLLREGEVIELSKREGELLEMLMRNPDQPLTRGQIGQRVWGAMIEEDSNVIEVYIGSLRRKCDVGFVAAESGF